MMAGNVLGKGYTAGVGMSIGTAFGRIAGTRAAAAARGRHNAEARHEAA
jgi:tricarballylate dehydrogenase